MENETVSEGSVREGINFTGRLEISAHPRIANAINAIIIEN